MFEEERQIRIMNEITERRSMSVAELASLLHVSNSTIRRDLSRMEANGLVKRTHGGAMIVEDMDNSLSYAIRSSHNGELKVQIARCAAEHIRDGETILLTSSSITSLIPRFLTAKNITVITNSLRIAEELQERNSCVLILLGGMYLKNAQTIEGPTTVTQLQTMKYDKAFIGVNGVDLSFGLSTASELEAATKIAAIKQAKESYCLCEHTKFGKTALYKLCSLKSVHCIITDDGLESAKIEEYGAFTRIRIAMI